MSHYSGLITMASGCKASFQIRKVYVCMIGLKLEVPIQGHLTFWNEIYLSISWKEILPMWIHMHDSFRI